MCVTMTLLLALLLGLTCCTLTNTSVDMTLAQVVRDWNDALTKAEEMG